MFQGDDLSQAPERRLVYGNGSVPHRLALACHQPEAGRYVQRRQCLHQMQRARAPKHSCFFQGLDAGFGRWICCKAPQVCDAPEGQRARLGKVGEKVPEMCWIGGIEPIASRSLLQILITKGDQDARFAMLFQVALEGPPDPACVAED